MRLGRRLVEIRVLGPVDAVDGDVPVPLGGPRPRTIVAVLALAADAVSIDRLVDEVWREGPPRSAVATLQSYLSRLRGVLGADRLVNGGRSYRLVTGPGTVDVERFRSLVASARRAVRAGDLATAGDHYRTAAAAWRGDVAEGIDGGPIVREAAARLAEERLIAIEEQVDVALMAGRHREVIPDLDALTTANPLRERLHGLRMLALYRSDRQADALVGFQVARRQLVDGLGIEPGPWLQLLQQRILAQDPGLEALEPSVFDVVGPDARNGAAHARPEAVAPSTAAVVQPAVSIAPPAASVPSSDPAAVPTGPTPAPQRPDDVPPRRPPPGRTTNLPAPLDTFVGRGSERVEIARLLDETRLLSLVGAGGCGKTQLALRVASDVRHRFPDGVWWVELAPHRAPEMVDRAVGMVLGAPEPTDGSWSDAIVERLSDGTQLLVLDNCEHLVERCAELAATVLRHCPDVTILTTSREPLDVAGERSWRVPSLAVPPADASASAVLASEAAQLLALRAAAVRPGFDLGDEDPRVIARVCRELDGIPLALELAAARLAVLSVEELAARLEDRFRVLSGGRRSAPARHRTLEAAIGWSYELLDAHERILLARLSVFAGGFTLPDVEVVCSEDPLRPQDVLDLVAALVDKSLVQRVRAPAGPARHDLLATVRSFAEAKLEPGERATLVARHAEHYTAIAEAARPELTGFEQVEWLNRLHAEQDNLRQVIEAGGEHAARIAASVWLFWLEFGHAREGDRWMTEVLREPATDDGRLLLQLHEGAARLADALGDVARSAEHLDEAERHARQLRDRSALVRCAALRASQAARQDDLDAATAIIERTDARLGDDGVEPWTVASFHQHRANVAARRGDLRRAAAAYRAAEHGFREVGDEWGACLVRLGAARIARRAGDRSTAVVHHRTNLTRGLDLTVSTLDFVGLPQDLHGLALVADDDQDHELAVTLLGAATTLRTAVEPADLDDEREDRRRVWDDAVAALGEPAVRRAFEAGRTDSAEDAVHLALRRTAQIEQDGEVAHTGDVRGEPATADPASRVPANAGPANGGPVVHSPDAERSHRAEAP